MILCGYAGVEPHFESAALMSQPGHVTQYLRGSADLPAWLQCKYVEHDAMFLDCSRGSRIDKTLCNPRVVVTRTWEGIEEDGILKG